MHTLIIICGGLSLLIASLLFGYAWGNGFLGLIVGIKLFIPIWFVFSFLNMWIGTQQGYSWSEEFPIFLGVLGVPVIAAALLWWKLSIN